MTQASSPSPSAADALRACRTALVFAGLFSAAASLLQLTVSLYMMQVFDRVFASRSLDTLYWLTVVALGALCLFGIMEGTRLRIMGLIGHWLEARLAARTFLYGLESRLRGTHHGAEALRDLSLVRGWVSSSGPLALFDLPWVPIYLVLIFLLHPLLGLMAVGGAALLVAFTFAGEMLAGTLHRTVAQSTAAGHRQAEMLLRNADVIDAMGMAGQALERWQATATATAPLDDRAAARSAVLLGLTRFVRQGLQIFMLGTGAWLVLRHDMTGGASIAASILIGRALAPVEQVIGGWKGLVQARQAWARVTTALSTPSLRADARPLPAVEGRIDVEGLSYQRANCTAPVLHGLSFTLSAGESVALVGPSGAGKTTLARLLIGTLSPGAGHVRLDGADIFARSRADLGPQVGYLPQTVELFEGTVFDNIARMGHAEAKAVHTAAMLAGCHEMILRLPNGYDTDVGEGGRNLSGGQRQMVGLARALFGSPRLLVLDEPNANQDTVGEACLMSVLDHLKAARATVLLISHRPSVLQWVDKILVLNEGRIENFGARADVLESLIHPVPASLQSPAAATGRQDPVKSIGEAA
ncbi:type I secretion system permease/ATPase [Shinella curvata]|uniref:Type I secretion system permease/ATPase n=1 Tax=Shinella curvata TaxID=1817964 RepID=A0ABT8XAG0_9HYPH|nr:type I secretion system permease/ATPase [Shinella curvata]MCJ8055180.1 type I secretion system permease/ATPase [Shinella curvata]MDO6120424.1 type I secretion system permease/ATPase [Shinella curvata]